MLIIVVPWAQIIYCLVPLAHTPLCSAMGTNYCARGAGCCGVPQAHYIVICEERIIYFLRAIGTTYISRCAGHLMLLACHRRYVFLACYRHYIYFATVL